MDTPKKIQLRDFYNQAGHLFPLFVREGIEQRLKLQDAFNEASNVYIQLHGDLMRSVQTLNEQDGQCERRSAFRSAFAFFEGVINTLANVSLIADNARPSTVVLSEIKRAALTEMDYNVQDNGGVKPARKKVQLKMRVVFVY